MGSENNVDSLDIKITASIKQASDSIYKLQKKLKGLDGSIKSIDTSKIDNIGKVIDKRTKSNNKLKVEIDTSSLDKNAKKSAENVANEFKKAKNKVKNELDFSKITINGMPSDDYFKSESNSKSTKKPMDAETEKWLKEREGKNQGLSKAEQFGMDWNNGKKKDALTQYNEAMEGIRKSARDSATFKVPEGVKELQKELDKLIPKLEEYRNKVNADLASRGIGKATDSTVHKKMIFNLEQMELKAKSYAEALEDAKEEESKIGNTNIPKSTQEYNPNNTKHIKLSQKALEGMYATALKIPSAFAKASKGAMNLGVNILKAKNPIAKISKAIDGIGDKLKNSRIIRSLMYSWINGTIKQLVNSIKAMMGEGFKSLAQYGSKFTSDASGFNKAISNMKSALMQLRNAFAVAFSPIIQIVEPYITAFIKKISQALNMVAQFFGALQGKTVVTQATDVWEDYGASIDKASDSAKSLKNQLQGFDKLNNLTSNSGSGSGSGGSGVTYEDMFNDSEINANVKSFADKIKDAWEKDGMHGLGNALRDIVIKNINGIDWSGMENKASKFGGNVAKFLCGLLDPNELGQTIGGSVGTAIAGAINVGISGFGGWLTEFEKGNGWANLGTNIAQMVSNAIDGIKWEGMIDIASKIGSGVATAINSFTSDDSKPMKKIGKSTANLIRMGIENFASFMETINFEDLGTTISDGINGFFEGLSEKDKSGKTGWQRLADGISDFSSGMLETMTTALDGISDSTWESIGQGIVDGICEIDWGKLTWDLGNFVVAVDNATTKAVDGMTLGATSSIVSKIFGISEEDVKTEVDKTGMTKLPSVMLDAMLGGFSAKDINIIKKLDFSSMWSAIKNWWSDKKIEMKVACGSIKEKISEKWSDAKTWWSKNGNLETLKTKIASIKDELIKKFNEAKNWAKSHFKLNFHIEYDKNVGAIKTAVYKALGLEGWPKFKFFANGGFPEDGTFRASHGEIMGRFDNGQTVVANNKQITDGIASAVFQGNQQNNALLQQQNMLLQQQNQYLLEIANKEFGISKDDVFRAVRQSDSQYKNMNGHSAFAY